MGEFAFDLGAAVDGKGRVAHIGLHFGGGAQGEALALDRAVEHALFKAVLGKSIGLTPMKVPWHVRLPTAMRIALPSLSNTYVSLFKDTSIASAIAVPELAYGMRWIETQTFRTVEVYLLATPIYLITSYAILLLLRLAERRFAVAR